MAALCVVALAAPRAHAEPPTARSAYVHVYAAEGLGEADRLRLEAALLEGARSAGLEKVKSGSEGQPPPGSAEAASAGLARADASLLEAQEKIKIFELDAAVDLTDWAIYEYARYLPALRARDQGAGKLLAALSHQAIAMFLNGDDAGAAAALERALVLNPALEYDETLFPPQMKEQVLEARFLADERGTGGLRVSSAEGAEIFVNGIPAGQTTATVADLPVGPNTVTVTLAGAEPQALVAKVAGGEVREERVEIAVMPSREVGAFAGTESSLGKSPTAGNLIKAAKAVHAEILILAVVKPGSPSTVTIYLHDASARRLRGTSPGELDAKTPAVSLRELGRAALDTAVWDDPVVVSAKAPPLWKHRYFWPAVGAVAGTVLVTSAIILIANDGLSNGQKIGLVPVISF